MLTRRALAPEAQPPDASPRASARASARTSAACRLRPALAARLISVRTVAAPRRPVKPGASANSWGVPSSRGRTLFASSAGPWPALRRAKAAWAGLPTKAAGTGPAPPGVATCEQRPLVRYLRTRKAVLVRASKTHDLQGKRESLTCEQGYERRVSANLVVELEDREVHRDHDEADDAADEDDHERLDQGGQRLDLGVHLGLVEVGDLGQHDLELARVLADRDHVRDHRREDLVLL